MSIILAIESSCDDTSAAVMREGILISNCIANQSIHAAYGGVVPELASRAHQQNIIPVVDEALKQAKVSKNELTAIAVTQGPGLLGALLVGNSFAKSMASALEIPLIAVNHMEAHVLAHFIEEPYPKFPFLCLTVSGGHTQIVKVDDFNKMEVIGETRDDAVGEAFDKTAKMLGLPYPGGPLIDRYAKLGNPEAYSFPIADIPALDYSFSGIKTAVLYFLQREEKKNPNFVEDHLNDICASVQKNLIDSLLQKLVKASKQYKVREIAIAGGVSANSGLRGELERVKTKYKWNVHVPAFEYCTDNAAMIAKAAYYLNQAGVYASVYTSPDPSKRF
ncbi:MAG: tRNA (adenosine(37)-N6)-threonylcarbamoyltransferase complex transferase subunit TsaD [Cyclobacteriaceae bacterium]|nr:tRNA (adenosine(37)-N6)-threonylcarbamoyltransferase complex transferase subunit TsaD [Cyclobacteriaceae bacterium]MCH8515276.1 tRNA (adenosine(37)-N6)-threonylcarbamoyltransferase complex transferase subunit TsaD [Cyclobacteriaceae bacterium]